MLHPRLAALLLLLVAAVGMVDTGVAAVVEGSTSGQQHHPPLLDCGPVPTTPSKSDDDAVFRANLSSALAEAQSAAATIGRAFAHGACFLSNVSSPAVTRACTACLSAAARDVIGRCGATSVRAGAWRDECFVSYADSDASTPREDAFRGWFYAGPTTPAALDGGYCVLDSTVCDRCFHDSARAAAAALGWLQRIHGEEVLVVGYNCLIRVKSSLPRGPDNGDAKSVALGVWMSVMVEMEAIILGMVFFRIVKIVRALPQVNG
ncbi:hypothetical protein EJB05_23961, partial [Eragrostis curvula]